MNIRKQIEKFEPFNEQESADKDYFLKFIDTFDDVLTRDNLFGHFSASAFVVNKERNKMLVVYHIINNGWIYPGGHADGNDDLLSVAIREVEEETGLKAKVLDENIFSIQANSVQPHVKRGKFVVTHTHFDVIYLLEADDTIPLTFKEDESKGVKWISFDEADGDGILSFVRPIHRKLIDKLKKSEYIKENFYSKEVTSGKK